MRRTIERALAGLALAGCTSGSGTTPSDPPCVPGLTPSCAATYSPPTFDTIFTNILQPNCSVGTGTCHTSDFSAGGIAFPNADAGYTALLVGDGGAGGGFVLPGDPGCSTLMKRLESADPSYRMPRGPTALSDGDLCTIVQWIAEGAKR